MHSHRPSRIRLGSSLLIAATLALLGAQLCPAARAFQRVTLRNGFSYDCARYESIDSDHIRLFFLSPHSGDFIDISTRLVSSIENLPDPPQPGPAPSGTAQPAGIHSATAAAQTPANIPQLLSAAGRQHRIDAALLASIIEAESDGRANAVSSAGAEGLMQLMPGTAQQFGVRNAFRPDQNITGGAAYLDQLLDRYDPHNDAHGLALALAAYNAGPAAVDRYHAVPPYPETRAYVNRVLREFMRRKLALQHAQAVSSRIGRGEGRVRDSDEGAAKSSTTAPPDPAAGALSGEAAPAAITIAANGAP
ncbi:MAG: lytic transglycosylase domain-containing protein [Acidobacteriota bacterium]